MKKIIVLLLTLVIGGMVSCSKIAGGPEAEAKALATETAKIMEVTTEKLNKAATGKEAGDALIEYANNMLQIAKKGEELQKKYKDLELMSDENFKNENEEINKMAVEFQKAIMGATFKFSGSKEFMAAVQKIGSLNKNTTEDWDVVTE
ncbi:MAG: hypothetical protein FWH53_03390 [Leptospirales bacterium]|nr:hypothetical protein [Leptospirales bacterium]